MIGDTSLSDYTIGMIQDLCYAFAEMRTDGGRDITARDVDETIPDQLCEFLIKLGHPVDRKVVLKITNMSRMWLRAIADSDDARDQWAHPTPAEIMENLKDQNGGWSDELMADKVGVSVKSIQRYRQAGWHIVPSIAVAFAQLAGLSDWHDFQWRRKDS